MAPKDRLSVGITKNCVKMMIPEPLRHVRTRQLLMEIETSAHKERRLSRDNSVLRERWLLVFSLRQATKHSLDPNICTAAFKRVRLVPFDPAAAASLARGMKDSSRG